MVALRFRGAVSRFVGLPLLALVVGTAHQTDARPADHPVLAIAGFDFLDTSGEVRDQSEEHAERLKAVTATLVDELSTATDLVKPAILNCAKAECSMATAGVPQLAERARLSGGRYLLFGRVHKMSTLVGWMKFAVVDLQADKPVCDRFLTYRGDTDEAWYRATRMMARDIVKNCLPGG